MFNMNLLENHSELHVRCMLILAKREHNALQEGKHGKWNHNNKEGSSLLQAYKGCQSKIGLWIKSLKNLLSRASAEDWYFFFLSLSITKTDTLAEKVSQQLMNKI